jgi:hypothetical protein
MNDKPQYLVRLNADGYYSPDTENPVPKEKALAMTHKEANYIANRCRRFYKSASMELKDLS